MTIKSNKPANLRSQQSNGDSITWVWKKACTKPFLYRNMEIHNRVIAVLSFFSLWGARFSDIHQGHIGDCYMLAAVAAIAANRKSFLRQAFVAYDLEVGVYGVMFCEEMHFRYEIVDDLLGLAYKPCGHGGSLQYARSTDRNEIWVSMLEKAYFKYMGCLEMCWGGYEGDAVFAFLGGVWGDYDVNGKPYTVWETLNRGHQNGDWAWASRIFSVFVEFVVIWFCGFSILYWLQGCGKIASISYIFSHLWSIFSCAMFDTCLPFQRSSSHRQVQIYVNTPISITS